MNESKLNFTIRNSRFKKIFKFPNSRLGVYDAVKPSCKCAYGCHKKKFRLNLPYMRFLLSYFTELFFIRTP